MTWSGVADVTTDFSPPADLANGYVVQGYVQDDYILPAGVWTEVTQVSTTWA